MEKINNYILIGNPVSHSLSPKIHNQFFKENNIKAFYETKCIEKLDKSIIENFYNNKILGINITLPYKQDIMEFVYKIDEDAKNINAINTLLYTDKGYIAYNTDIDGIKISLLENKIDIKNKNALVLGAGGSGYTASYLLVKEGANVILSNRTYAKAIGLKAHIKDILGKDIFIEDIKDINKLKNIDLVINTTSVGFYSNSEKEILKQEFFNNNNNCFVMDIIYNPKITPLLALAKKNGIKCTNGFSMLVYQALKAQEIWQNINIPLDYKIDSKNKLYKIIE